MSEPSAESADLTREERNAIRSLRALAKRWPPSLRLVSMDGSLSVVRTNDERFWADDGATRQEAIVADDFDGIPNEGGGW